MVNAHHVNKTVCRCRQVTMANHNRQPSLPYVIGKSLLVNSHHPEDPARGREVQNSTLWAHLWCIW